MGESIATREAIEKKREQFLEGTGRKKHLDRLPASDFPVARRKTSAKGQ